MATSRAFYANYLSENSPTVTMVASGGAVANAASLISTAQPVKQGYATGTALGTYTGIVDRFYRVEIHVAGTGAFGSAQWRWTDNYQGASTTWNASNLTTQNNVAVTLNNGAQFRFNANGSFTPQFALLDYWTFVATLKYGYQKALDGTRDQEYRSGTMPAASTIEQQYDFGSAVNPTGFVLLDHNIPSNATISLKLKSTGFTDPPSTTVTIPWASRKMIVVLNTGPFRYWRVCVTLSVTPLTYLRWSGLFLGSSLVFDKTFNIGFQDASEWMGALNLEALRRGPGPRMLEGRNLHLTYGHMSSADQAKLATLRAWMNDPTYNVMRPFYFWLIDSDASNFGLFNWTNGYVKDHEFLERYSDPLELIEVIRSRAA